MLQASAILIACSLLCQGMLTSAQWGSGGPGCCIAWRCSALKQQCFADGSCDKAMLTSDIQWDLAAWGLAA
jgi:hypothetical protein